MFKFGVKSAAVALVAGVAYMPVPSYADGGISDFIMEILSAPRVYDRYYGYQDYREQNRPVVKRAPTNLATVRANALPPKPYVALRQANLKPGKEMGTYATALHEQLTAPSTQAPRVKSAHRKEIIKFYKGRNFKPLWLGDYGMAVRAKRLLVLMSKAGDEGLNAIDYLPASLSDFKDKADYVAGSPVSLAKLEVEITAAALEYSHHISAGRVKPLRISKLHTLDAFPEAPGDVLNQLQSTLRPDVYLNSLQPTIPQYRHLKKALVKYRGQSDAEKAIFIPAGRLIHAGGYDHRLELIAKRLHQLGFYEFKSEESESNSAAESTVDTPLDPTIDATVENTETGVSQESTENNAALESTENNDVSAPQITAANPKPSLFYSADLVKAVKDMQEQSGLRRDGIIGNRTVAALNGESGAEKVTKIILSLERLRWLPRDLKRKYVFINQAFYETWMIEDGKEIFRSDVIVGKPYHQTAVFSDEMDKVVLNPRWYVPRSIIYNEMMPKLYNNPYYLQDQGYEVLDVKGRLVDSASINWSQYNEKNIPYNVRQPAGPKNALGRVKFLFPNKHAIYMHDTPSRGLFKRKIRSLSHGCVRVQKPMEFAEIILKTEGWSPAKIAKAIATGQNQTIHLSRKIPVYLGYYTAWADADGNVKIKNDVYNRDRVLNQALAQNDKARAPRKYALNN